MENQIVCMPVSLLVGLLRCWNETNVGISSVLDEISFWYFWMLAWNVCTPDQNNSKFLVFLSVCYMAISLLKLCKYRDIYSSGWYICLNFFGGLPGMFVHQIKIILNFLYVCHSVSWLTYLMKLCQYRDISSSG